MSALPVGPQPGPCAPRAWAQSCPAWTAWMALRPYWARPQASPTAASPAAELSLAPSTPTPAVGPRHSLCFAGQHRPPLPQTPSTDCQGVPCPKNGLLCHQLSFSPRGTLPGICTHQELRPLAGRPRAADLGGQGSGLQTPCCSG